MFNFITQASSPKNIQKSCRICLMNYKKLPYYNVFKQTLPDSDVRLCDAIHQITSVKFCLNDGLPIRVCASCESRVVDAYMLKLQTERNTEKLINIVTAKEMGMYEENKCEYNESEDEKKQEPSSTQKTNTKKNNQLHSRSSFTVDNKKNDSVAVVIPTIEFESDRECEEGNSTNSKKTKISTKTNLNKESKFNGKNSNTSEYKVVEPAQVAEKDVIEEIQMPTLKLEPIYTSNLDYINFMEIKEQSEITCTSPQVQETIIELEITGDDSAMIVESIQEKPNKTISNKKSNLITLDDPSPKRKYACNVCLKNFAGKYNLIEHLRLHANIKPYKCQYCGKCFTQSGNFACHLRIHTKERPYKCEVCLKTYNQSSALKVHMRSHTNERNYICDNDNCNKAFTNASDLKKHKRIHNNVQMFKCDYCTQTSNQKSNIMKHIRSKHSNEEYKVKKLKDELLNKSGEVST